MSTVQTTISGPVATITMMRADKRNALNEEMVSELSAAFANVESNSSVKVVVLRGDGKAFCAGADLEYLQTISQNSAEENLEDSTRLMLLMKGISECSKPVIAMVQGPAIAGGCGLATVCDIVVASRQHAVFGYSEVKIGFIPAIVMVYLLRKIGDTQSRKLILTAKNIDATEAQRIGLITDVVEHDQLESYTNAMANDIAQNSSTSIALSKRMLNALHGMSVDSGLQYAAAMNALVRQTQDCKDGIQNFLSKK
ncbi:MAG: enoyl-CoA hydratase/isomerase family protein [Ignavibacteria bacterium]|nr:enoyl-CoA hydratase/isomerase family protein [Ignavibacteria bacterium]